KVSKIFSAKKKTGIIIAIKHANLITVQKNYSGGALLC
ncbi:hypothetical protein NT03LS_2650, partial [Listeria seeligeri FSL N1-067]